MIGAQTSTRLTRPDWVPTAKVLILLPDHRLPTTQRIPLNKTGNIVDFIQPALGEPDPDPVPAYVPDTQPDTKFLCSFHP